MWLMRRRPFFFNDTATTEIYTLSRHDALPISSPRRLRALFCRCRCHRSPRVTHVKLPSSRGSSTPSPLYSGERAGRSEEHTSELQSRPHLVCRLLLVKKKPSTAYTK